MAITSIESKREEPGRRERQRLETRNRLYEAALAEFRRMGFTKAQIDRIAEQAGVARGTFYFHFPTKEHVLFELQRRLEEGIVERFTAVSQRPSSVKAFLLEVTGAMASVGAEVGDPALSREIMAMYVREPRVVDLSANPLVVSLVDYFSEAAERGEVRSDIAPEDIVGIFLTSLFGFVATGPDPMEERAAEFARIIDVFVRGITP